MRAVVFQLRRAGVVETEIGEIRGRMARDTVSNASLPMVLRRREKNPRSREFPGAELKILLQLLRLEDEFILQKISKQGKEDNTSQDIPDKRRQGSCLFALI